MNKTLRNILAVVVGVIAGSAVNMGIVMISEYVIANPAGADSSTVEGLKATIHLFEPKHFIMPFLAHFVGTFVGAILAALIADNRKIIFAMVVGVFFLAGGITNAIMLPAPAWFIFVDLVFAYIPAAWLGRKMVK